MVQKEKIIPDIWSSQDLLLKNNSIEMLKVKGQKKICQANTEQRNLMQLYYCHKKKTVFKAKSIIKDNEGQYRMMKGVILLEGITVICFYAI